MKYDHHNEKDPRHPAGDPKSKSLRLVFDRRLKLEFESYVRRRIVGLFANSMMPSA